MLVLHDVTSSGVLLCIIIVLFIRYLLIVLAGAVGWFCLCLAVMLLAGAVGLAYGLFYGWFVFVIYGWFAVGFMMVMDV